ncbi:propanol-preferring alcohol dehydrogenase [Microdochium nivale]|nr:propanol-preferring alcohol dehydrogenase [Microdochium nivale]
MTEGQDTHRAAVLVRGDGGDFRFDVQERPIPVIRPWEVLVKLSAVGVCGTDLTLAAGHIGPTCDILGHEGVGRVVKIGSGVDPSVVRLNDLVGIGWVRDYCGQCEHCRLPEGETRCVQQLNSGRKIDGCFAEHCVVSSRYILVLPGTVPDELAAPVLCGGVTAYKALKACGAVPGEWVAISGAGGGVGAFAVQYARAMGYRVLAIDVGDSKESFCLEQGAEVYCDALDKQLPSLVSRATGGARAKAVIVAAGSIAAYQGAVELAAAYGTIVCVGIPPPHQQWTVHPLNFIDTGIKIIGVAVGTRTDTLEALRFVERGVVTPTVHLSTLEELSEISSKVATTMGKYVIKF